MMVRNRQRKMPTRCLVQLAIAALDGNPSPMEVEMGGIDPDPTSHDLGKPDNRNPAKMGAARGGRSASAPPCVRL
jgi:hypothetical protein